MLNNEQVETQPIVETNDVNSGAPEQVEEASTPIEDNSAETAESPQESHEAPPTEGELPEFAKRRLGREQKKYERKLAALEAELHAERARANAQPPQSFQSGTLYSDPLTGKTVDIATPEGQERYKYLQEVDENLKRQASEKAQADAKKVENELYNHIYESFEDAKERHTDFVQVMTSSGLDEPLAKELAYFPDPGALGYYICSNPREVARLKNLPAYEVKRELARHLTDMVSKKKVTNAPAPVNKPRDSISGKSSNFRIKSVEQLMAEKKEQRGSKRR